MTEYNFVDHPLKRCPFCGSKASRTGGSLGGVVVKSCRCSNDNCIASRCSVDYDVWNSRPKFELSESTTVGEMWWGKAEEIDS